MKLSVADEVIQTLLSGVYRSGKSVFFRIDESTGKHIRVRVRASLMKLGLTHGQAACIVAAFPFPKLKFYSDDMREIDAAKGRPKGNKAKVSLPVDDLNDDEPIDGESEEPVSSKHYYLIQRGDYYGCHYEQDGTEVLFRSREEAVSYMSGLINGEAVCRSYYGRSPAKAAEEVQPINYND